MTTSVYKYWTYGGSCMETTQYRFVPWHLLHREDGPAFLQFIDGILIQEAFLKRFYKYETNVSLIHQENGPAIIHYNSDGSKRVLLYCIEGINHRIDGPAKIIYDKEENNTEQYFLEGEEFSLEEWQWLVKAGIFTCRENWTNEEQLMYDLRFA